MPETAQALTAEEIAGIRYEVGHQLEAGDPAACVNFDAVERLLACAERDSQAKAEIAELKALLAEKETMLREAGRYYDAANNKANRLDAEAFDTCAENAKLLSLNAEMLAVLRSVEWNGFDVICDDVCPKCGERKPDGHALDCTLSAAIKKAGG